MPGADTGMMIWRSVVSSPAPSIGGRLEDRDRDLGEERAHHPHRDRQVHRRCRGRPAGRCCPAGPSVLREQVDRQQAGHRGQHLGGQEEEHHVVHFAPAGSTARTPRGSPAAAPGWSSRCSRQAELISGGHGLAPDVRRRTPGSPRGSGGARTDGGLVAASCSLCSEVSTIQATGTKNSDRRPATRARSAPCCRLLCFLCRWSGGRRRCRWCSRGGAHRLLLPEQGRHHAQGEGRDDDRADDHDDAGGGRQAVVVGAGRRSGRSCTAGWPCPARRR